jgi:asparagine N-glycosylation enzyme membrane subunit Stt3
LLALRRWRLPFGALSLILIGNNLLMAWFHARDLRGYAPLFGVMLLAGLAADLLNRALRPSPDRVGAFRLFAFLVPVVTYSLFFGTLIALEGVWWSIHMWAGVIVQAGIVGLLVSWMVLPGEGGAA